MWLKSGCEAWNQEDLWLLRPETTSDLFFRMAKPIPFAGLFRREYDVDPMDSLWDFLKVVNEKTARSFHDAQELILMPLGSEDVDWSHTKSLSCFRIISKNPEVRRRNAKFCYMTQGLGQIVDLCWQKNDLVFQIFQCWKRSQWCDYPKQKDCGNVFPRCGQLPAI